MTQFHRSRCAMIVLAGVLALAVPRTAGATTIIDNLVGFPTATLVWEITGQTFTVPLTDSVLESWTYEIAARDAPGTIDFAIYSWAGSVTGSALYSTVLNWSAGGQFTVSGIDLALTPGSTYIAVFDLLGYAGSSLLFVGNTYGGGQGAWALTLGGLDASFEDNDHRFRATFDGAAAPEPASLLLLATGVATAFGVRRRRQQKV